MKFKVELRCIVGDQEEVHQVACLERAGVALATLSLTLAEGKAILKAIQAVMVEKPLAVCVERQRHCPDCRAPRPSKGQHDVTLRTAFGNLIVNSPRFHHCACHPRQGKTFSPLAELLPEHTAPELLFLETKWTSLVSYGATADLLKDVLPVDEKLNDDLEEAFRTWYPEFRPPALRSPPSEAKPPVFWRSLQNAWLSSGTSVEWRRFVRRSMSDPPPATAAGYNAS
jgi:hypothetical protein